MNKIFIHQQTLTLEHVQKIDNDEHKGLNITKFILNMDENDQNYYFPIAKTLDLFPI